MLVVVNQMVVVGLQQPLAGCRFYNDLMVVVKKIYMCVQHLRSINVTLMWGHLLSGLPKIDFFPKIFVIENCFHKKIAKIEFFKLPK